MNYITVKETAEKWGVTERMVRTYCVQDRIPNAIQIDGSWQIPKDAKKPSRQAPEKPADPKLVQYLQRRRTKHLPHTIYDYIQVQFCYASNRFAGNTLTHNQVEEIYLKSKVSVGTQSIKIDDLIEAYNHLDCIDHILDTATARLSQSYIRKLHSLLGYGTIRERKGKFRSGEYRRNAYAFGNTAATPPKEINAQLNALLAEYESRKTVDLSELVDFHIRFERIRPFSDGNGRIGRLLMFKECLRHEITPFVISSTQRQSYFTGLRQWDTDPSILLDTCKDAQQQFLAQIKLQKLLEKAQRNK